MSALGKHRELWAIYGRHAMNQGNVRQWCRIRS
jgi:hypothetical protein